MRLLPLLLFVVGCSLNCVSPGEPVDPPPAGNEITYEQVATLITARCVKCHGGAGGYSFDSKAGILKAVKPGDAANSELCFVVRNGLMPPKNPLTGDEVDIICDWIEEGAKS